MRRLAILIVVAGLWAVGASPAAAQQGPPPDVPQGPPTDVPRGPPTDVPQGPPPEPPGDDGGGGEGPEPPGDDGGGGGAPEPPGDDGGGGGAPEPPGDDGGGGGAPEPPGDDGGGGGSPVETPSAGGGSNSDDGGSGGGGSGGGGSGGGEGSGSESCPCAAPATGYPVAGDSDKIPKRDGTPDAASDEPSPVLAASRSESSAGEADRLAGEVLGAGAFGTSALGPPSADAAQFSEDSGTILFARAMLALIAVTALIGIAGGLRAFHGRFTRGGYP
jgi:hypothetical protein